jgi:hypothetical protein
MEQAVNFEQRKPLPPCGSLETTHPIVYSSCVPRRKLRAARWIQHRTPRGSISVAGNPAGDKNACTKVSDARRRGFSFSNPDHPEVRRVLLRTAPLHFTGPSSCQSQKIPKPLYHCSRRSRLVPRSPWGAPPEAGGAKPFERLSRDTPTSLRGNVQACRFPPSPGPFVHGKAICNQADIHFPSP